ncbi:MAG: alpha/beta hydrolase [Saprospiraceae bacterium]
MSCIKYTFLLAIIGLVTACNSNQKEIKKTTAATPKATVATPSTVVNYSTHNVPWSEISSLEKVDFDYLVPYGEEELQIGELRTPLSTKDTFPLVIFIHGGCWLSDYNLDHVSAVCADLVKEGYAVWTPEYRRVGDEGGGYPNTFKDVQASVDFARTLADIYPLDLENVVVMGHSAGGHLALWLATQQNLAKNSRLHNSNPLPIKGAIALAGITDLVAYDKIGNDCSTAVVKLMGGTSEAMDSRYYKGSPINLLPTNIPIRLVHGDKDNIVPISQSEIFAKKAKAKGVDVKVLTIAGGGHFDMVSPYAEAWKVIKGELAALID